MYATYETFTQIYLKHYPEHTEENVKEEYLGATEVLVEVLFDPILIDMLEFKLELIKDISWLDFGEAFSSIGEGVVNLFVGIIEAITSGIEF